jgi:hypothetical protein
MRDYRVMLAESSWRTRLAYWLREQGSHVLGYLVVHPDDVEEFAYRDVWPPVPCSKCT